MSFFRKMGEYPENSKKLFALLYHRYHKIPFGVAYRLTQKRQSAEDIAQETFERAFENFAHFKDTEHFIRWLVVTATRLAIDELKKYKNYFLVDEIPEGRSQENSPEPLLLRKEQKKDIISAINSLKPAYRTVIILRYLSEIPHAEIAARLNLSESAVRVRAHRAMKELGKRLQMKSAGQEGGRTDAL